VTVGVTRWLGRQDSNLRIAVPKTGRLMKSKRLRRSQNPQKSADF
jgi:hypothetical protein